MSAQQIKTALEQARKALQTAQEAFREGECKLQAKASQSIDLFSGSTTSRVAQIAAMSRDLCDALYTACQIQAKLLDETCRPFLDESVPAEVVKDVWQLLRQLNEESDITNNFTASFNGQGLGDMATVQYHPTMEAKLAEKYWENKYQNWPGREKYEKQLQLEAQKKEKARKEAVKKVQDDEVSQYRQDLEKWEARTQEVKIKREQMLEKELTRQHNQAREQIVGARDQKLEKYAKQEEQTVALRRETEAALAQLRFYEIFRKMQLRKTIHTCERQLADLQQQQEEANRVYREELQQLEKTMKQRKAQVQEMIFQKHPLPRKPRKPAALLYKNPTHYQVIAEYMKNEIIKTLVKHGKLTYMELMQKNSNLNDLTYQTIVNYAKALQQEGEIKITKEKSGIIYDDFCSLAY